MKFSKKKSLLIGCGSLLILVAVVLLICNLTIWTGSKNYSINFALIALFVFMGIVNVLLGIFSHVGDKKKIITTKMISMVGVMGAISTILYLFVKFPLGIFPSFLDMQISEIPALIAGFAYGPVAGALVIVIRCIIKLPFTGTACVGELADLIIGLTLVVPSSIIYKRNRTLKGALKGFILSAVLSTAVALLANWLILIPFYIEMFFKGSIAPLLSMCSMIPGINESNYMVLYLFVGNLPFNLVRYIVVGIFTFVTYKGVHRLINNITA